MPSPSFVLTLSCLNRPGIVAAFSSTLFRANCNITDAQQFDDTGSGRFFARVMFDPNGAAADADVLRAEIGTALRPFKATWSIRDRSSHRRIMVFVSKLDHCLADIIYRWRIGELEMDLAGIISNHPKQNYTNLSLDGIPFHYLPVYQGQQVRSRSADRAIVEPGKNRSRRPCALYADFERRTLVADCWAVASIFIIRFCRDSRVRSHIIKHTNEG